MADQTPSLGRRRFIAITAVAGVALTAGLRRSHAEQSHIWRGAAMGGEASIRLYHPDRAEAELLLARCAGEVERLERIFSLYRPDSELVRLNRDGHLAQPAQDMVRLLSESQHFARLSGGAFDPTVQPLFRMYAEHFGDPQADPRGPEPATIARVLTRVEWKGLQVDPSRIAFTRPGMEVTLNGIAQGYMTDRITDMLTRAGLEQALVNLGEIRAVGHHPDGRPWTVGILAPDNSGKNDRMIGLQNAAVATSAPSGTMFDAEGRFHHLFDPSTGRCTTNWQSVTVMAPTATAADALSKAFSTMGEMEIRVAVRQLDHVQVFARTASSTIHVA